MAVIDGNSAANSVVSIGRVGVVKPRNVIVQGELVQLDGRAVLPLVTDMAERVDQRAGLRVSPNGDIEIIPGPAGIGVAAEYPRALDNGLVRTPPLGWMSWMYCKLPALTMAWNRRGPLVRVSLGPAWDPPGTSLGPSCKLKTQYSRSI